MKKEMKRVKLSLNKESIAKIKGGISADELPDFGALCQYAGGDVQPCSVIMNRTNVGKVIGRRKG